MRERLTSAWFRAVVPLEAGCFIIGAFLHTGVTVVGRTEAFIVPAIVVEAVCGTVLTLASVSYYNRREWWPTAILAAQLIAAGGVMLGIVALAAGRGESSTLNDAFHRTVLVPLGIGL